MSDALAQPITLGKLIDALSALPETNTIAFDFGNIAPDGIDSYRGYYDHLALEYRDRDGENPTVGEVLAYVRAADGKVFTGYKGGDYRMDRETPVWVANYGRSGNTCVTGVYTTDYGYSYILTGLCMDWAGGMERARQVLFGGLGFGNA